MVFNSMDEQQLDQLAFESMLQVCACWLSPDNSASFIAESDDSLTELYASVKIASALFLVDQAMGREHQRKAQTH